MDTQASYPAHRTDGRGRTIPHPCWPADRNAPGELELVRRFVNSQSLETGADRFRTRSEAREWLQTEYHTMALTSSDLAEIVGLRQVLRTGIEDPSTLVELNRFESQVRLTFNDLRDQRRRTALEPEGKGARLLLSTLIAITWTAVGNGTWLQLKSCENQECRWVIFDHSRNATLRWCSDSACGSRERARRYRARQLRTP